MRSAGDRAGSCARRLAHLASLMEGAKGRRIVEAADEMREHVDAQWHLLADSGREALERASVQVAISPEDMGDLATIPMAT